MKFRNKTILFCAQYAASYKGNFIKSLEALADRLTQSGCKVYFLFPKLCKNQLWWKDFCAEHDAMTIDHVADVMGIERILNEINPDLIHTHFDGFDIPVAKAVANTGLETIQVWHLHNCFSFVSHPLKALYQCYCYYLHYNWYAKGAVLIGVGQHLIDFVGRFRKLLFYPRPPLFVVPNGIDISRIRPRSSFKRHSQFTFLAFGGRNADKRIDLLIRAAENLSDYYDLKVIITEGADTQQLVHTLFPEHVPEWLELVKEQDDISYLFDLADCYVSSSVHESFSYAICEATIYGLPVIQSDIHGTLWNSLNESAFLFHSEDIQDLSRVMQKVMEQSDESMMLKCKSTQRLNSMKYSLDHWTSSICEIYSNLFSR